MISYQVKECNDCCDLVETYHAILGKLCDYGGISLQNLYYLSGKKIDKRKLKNLIYYKFIFQKLMRNPQFYTIKYTDIISKVKTYL